MVRAFAFAAVHEVSNGSGESCKNICKQQSSNMQQQQQQAEIVCWTTARSSAEHQCQQQQEWLTTASSKVCNIEKLVAHHSKWFVGTLG